MGPVERAGRIPVSRSAPCSLPGAVGVGAPGQALPWTQGSGRGKKARGPRRESGAGILSPRGVHGLACLCLSEVPSWPVGRHPCVHSCACMCVCISACTCVDAALLFCRVWVPLCTSACARVSECVWRCVHSSIVSSVAWPHLGASVGASASPLSCLRPPPCGGVYLCECEGGR